MSDTPRCRILVRTAVDWRSMTPERFREQNNPYQPPIFLRGAVDHDLPGVFSRSFGVDYFRYRGELQRIARRSLEAVDGATITTGFEDFESWFYDDTDEFIFPIDDDDLFAPDLAQTVAGIGDEIAIVVWCHVMAGFVNFDNVAAVQDWKDWPVLFSNNWGVRKSFLRAQYGPEDAKKFLAQHHFAQGEAVRAFGIPIEHRPPGVLQRYASLIHSNVRILEGCYGVDYMHPGSLQFFSRVVQSGSPEETYRAYKLDAELEVPDYIRWAAPYLEELREIAPRLRREAGASSGNPEE